jgi:hypothetical protein
MEEEEWWCGVAWCGVMGWVEVKIEIEVQIEDRVDAR